MAGARMPGTVRPQKGCAASISSWGPDTSSPLGPHRLRWAAAIRALPSVVLSLLPLSTLETPARGRLSGAGRRSAVPWRQPWAVVLTRALSSA